MTNNIDKIKVLSQIFQSICIGKGFFNDKRL
jgi:hypothetical protein